MQKSYKDWNTSWPQNSWTITEPAIYTQASYARLISQFVSPSSPSQIKLVIQGFYNTSANKMNSKDTVRAYLRNNFSPYNIADSAKAVVDSVSFDGSFLFVNAASGTYYIVIKHRNSIETWSKAGGEIYNSGSPLTFNFNLDSSKSYGNNVIRINSSPLTYGIYSGDVNQNGTIDAQDLGIVDTDAYNFLNGYVRSDINGNNVVDAVDASITGNNAFNFVSKMRP
jgi:hypothetical protein